MGNLLDQLFVYHPTPWTERDWGRVSGLPLEDVWFSAADGTSLFGWYVESSASPAVLLWCHGNAGNIINRLDNLAELYRLGISVFLFDYRGYGRSRGGPSEGGLYQDALGAYAYLLGTRRTRPDRIVLFGRSLGAAVAGEGASQRAAAGLILESAFPSVEALARAHYFGLPVHWQPERSEEHTSELQSQSKLLCRLLLEKKKRAWTCQTPLSAWSTRSSSGTASTAGMGPQFRSVLRSACWRQ